MRCADLSIHLQRSLFTALLAAAVLTGCQPELKRNSPPTPAVMTVQVTSALLALEEEFHHCASEMENTGLVLLERPAQAIDLSQSTLALHWGYEGPWNAEKPSFAAVVGHEILVVVTNPSNPVERISRADLQAIYTGKMRSWSKEDTTAEIQAWMYLPGEDPQEIFEAALGIPSSSRAVYRAPDPQAMREAIAANPNAIGYLPERWVDSSVKVVTVDEMSPAVMSRPLLAWSQFEPNGDEKIWLLCLQEQMGK